MSTTIFCTFEQQDIADLAAGRLRNTVIGIKSIHYIREYRPPTDFFSWTGAAGAWNAAAAPSRPVTMKIVCADAAAPGVKARLINMHAYQIITTR